MSDTDGGWYSPFPWVPQEYHVQTKQETSMNATQKRILASHMRCVLSHKEMTLSYDLVQRIIDALYTPHDNRDLAEQLEQMADNFRAKVEDQEMENQELIDRLAEAVTEEEDLYQTRGNSRA